MPTTTFEERLAEMAARSKGSRRRRVLVEARRSRGSSVSSAHCASRRRLPVRLRTRGLRPSMRSSSSSRPGSVSPRAHWPRTLPTTTRVRGRRRERATQLGYYFERLQAQTALRAASAREQSEAAISDLRRRRNTLAEWLADSRSAAGEAWDEQKKRIAAARDDLERKADEVSAKFN